MKVFSIVAAGAVLVSMPQATVPAEAAASHPDKTICAHIDGYIDGPFVPTAVSARRVYLTIRNAICCCPLKA
jgi:hypothetical protein